MSKGKRSTLLTRKKWKREINPKALTNKPSTSTAADLRRKETMEAPVETDPSAAF